MRLSPFVLIVLASLALPAVSAAAPGPVVPVGVCVAEPTDDYGCFRDSDVCVSAFSWVPQCADVPCYRPNDCVSVRDPCDLFCSSPCDHGCDAPAQGPPYECMQVYREWDLGPVRIVQRDSCHTEVYFDDDLGPLA